jgi:hypothetical protein
MNISVDARGLTPDEVRDVVESALLRFRASVPTGPRVTIRPTTPDTTSDHD